MRINKKKKNKVWFHAKPVQATFAWSNLIAIIVIMLALLLDYIDQGGNRMKYVNATTIFLDTLIQELQKYVQTGYIYIPTKDKQYKSWGELPGCRKEPDKRNKAIVEKHRNGVSTEELIDEYYLPVYAIGKIIYQKWWWRVVEEATPFFY